MFFFYFVFLFFSFVFLFHIVPKKQLERKKSAQSCSKIE